MVVLEDVGKPRRRAYSRRRRIRTELLALKAIERRGFQVVAEAPRLPMGEIRGPGLEEELPVGGVEGCPIPDGKLAGLDSYKFRFNVWIDVGAPKAEEIAAEIRKAAFDEYTIMELYSSLAILGYRHLSYLFDFPPDRAWSRTSRAIRRHKYVLYNSYAFPSDVLALPWVRRELRSLRRWLRRTKLHDDEFLDFALAELATEARRNQIKYGTPVEELMPSNLKELLEEAYMLRPSLRSASRLLWRVGELAKRHGTRMIVELFRP